MVHRCVAVAATVLIATLALCLLHAAHAVGDQPCSTPAVASVGVAMVAVVMLIGGVLPGADEPYRLCPSDPLAPPPRA